MGTRKVFCRSRQKTYLRFLKCSTLIKRELCNIEQTWRFLWYNNENVKIGIMCTVGKIDIERKTANILN